MAPENVDVLLALGEALNRRDIEAALELVDPEVVLAPSLVGGVERSRYRGHEGYRAWFEQQFETYEQIHFEPRTVRAAGDVVVAVYTTWVRARHSGIEIESTGATVFRLRAGRVVEQVGYQRAEEALASTGLTAQEPLSVEAPGGGRPPVAPQPRPRGG